MKETSIEILLQRLEEFAEEPIVTLKKDVDYTSFANGLKFGVELMQRRLKFYLNLYKDNVKFEKELAEMRNYSRRTTI